MRFGISALVFIGLLLIRCSDNPTSGNDKVKINHVLVDSLATEETVNLFKNLKAGLGNGVLFGQQSALAYGIGWKAETNRSDINDVCGDFPAVYGWDLGDIGNETNLDGVNFEDMKFWINEVYKRGGVNTISMHLDNPVSDGSAWDNSKAVSFILEGGTHHESYLNTLDLIAAFLKDLKTKDGTMIPVIFRPYHEHNHTWSWWGKGNCTIEEYNSLWQMTIRYLRDDHDIHHLIYAISPQEIQSEEDYFEIYPGDEYVDILGLDYYKLWSNSNVADLGETLDLISGLAESRGKISALTEVGMSNPDQKWWTENLLPAVKYNSHSLKTSYLLIWRNANVDHHFGPYPGHRSEADFITFYNDPLILFENDLSELYKQSK